MAALVPPEAARAEVAAEVAATVAEVAVIVVRLRALAEGVAATVHAAARAAGVEVVANPKAPAAATTIRSLGSFGCSRWRRHLTRLVGERVINVRSQVLVFV